MVCGCGVTLASRTEGCDIDHSLQGLKSLCVPILLQARKLHEYATFVLLTLPLVWSLWCWNQTFNRDYTSTPCRFLHSYQWDNYCPSCHSSSLASAKVPVSFTARHNYVNAL